ncbi:hypothetical protein IKE67_07795 [bacterium]|nr:hypothetical protein [bacterium]
MTKDNIRENIIPFKRRKTSLDTEIIKPSETKIIDLFTSKKNLTESKFNKKTSNQFYINGRSLFLCGKYERAFENLKKAEEAGCNNIDLFLLLSRSYGIKGDIQKSEDYAIKAIETDKKCAEGYYLAVLGQVTQNKISEETAKFAVKAIMYGFEADDMIYYYAALFFMDDNHSNYKKAKKYIMSAIDNIQYAIEQDKKEKLFDSDKLRKLTIFYQIKADACFYLQEYDEAFTLYTTCENNGLIALSIYLNKSIIYHERKDDDNALKYINKAFECYKKTKEEKDKELFEFLNYMKALILSQLNDETCFKYLEKSGNFFKDKKILKERKEQVKQINEHNKALRQEITEIINEIIKILADCENEEELQKTFPEVFEHLGEEIIKNIILAPDKIKDKNFKNFIKYAKKRLN